MSEASERERWVVPVGGLPRTARSPYAKRILVVEDDFDARLALEELFSAYGFETSVAKDGAEALALLQAGIPYHFVVLDLAMPRMSGFEFLRHKRRLPEPARSVPVAVTSALDAPFIADIIAIWRKPTPLLELLQVIEQQIGPANAPPTSSAG